MSETDQSDGESVVNEYIDSDLQTAFGRLMKATRELASASRAYDKHLNKLAKKAKGNK